MVKELKKIRSSKNFIGIIIGLVIFVILVVTFSVMGYFFYQDFTKSKNDNISREHGLSQMINAMENDPGGFEEVSPNKFVYKSGEDSDDKELLAPCDALVETAYFYGDIVNVEDKSDREILDQFGVYDHDELSSDEMCTAFLAFIRTMYSYELNCWIQDECDVLIEQVVDAYMPKSTKKEEVFDYGKLLSEAYFQREISADIVGIGYRINGLLEDECYLLEPRDGEQICRGGESKLNRWTTLSGRGFEWGGCAFKVERDGDQTQFQFCAEYTNDDKVIRCTHEKCYAEKTNGEIIRTIEY